ncbi:MAG: HlyD family secretion protein, partial [Gammaproteobacteria bacterium]|nr:HlyD family secretion protein [Gammaproteobacteria bacterium]
MRRLGTWTLMLFHIASAGSAVAQSNEGAVRGLVKASAEAVISSEIGARITSIPFRPGDSFKKGEALVKFDCGLLRADLRSARATLLARQKKHANNQQLAELDAIGQVDVEVSGANQKEAAAHVASAGIRAKKCVIRAPYAGHVVERFAHPYESVAPEQKLLH